MASAIGGVPASNFHGSSLGVNPSRRDVADHLAAAEERRHGVEQLLAAPQHADAGGAEHLVAGEGEEVGARGGDVGGEVGHVLAGVDHGDGAGGVGGVGERARPA